MTEKILMIDDDLDTLRLVGLMLQRQGYQISAASNGSQGLDKAFEEEARLDPAGCDDAGYGRL
jgi:DNA-binding response OmpR family regulator